MSTNDTKGQMKVRTNEKAKNTQLAFYLNLYRAVIGPSATLTGRWRPDIDLRRMLTGYIPVSLKMYVGV